jgi:ABC-type nitrate/sulfonate/bicarbonate transport system substrate-binding protein
MTAHDNQQHIESMLTSLGFYSVPSLPLASDSSLPPSKILSIEEYALGQEGLTVSPLQMVMAAAALTANGKLPNPLLAMSVNIPQQGWSILNTGSSSVQVLLPDQAVAAVQALTVQAFPGWQSIGTAVSGSNQVLTWYLGGTIPAWQGSPFAIAVLLESNNPVLAEQIGQSLIKAVQNP